MTEILTPTQYSILWGGTGAMMFVHSIGAFAGYYSHTNPVYYVILACLLTLSGLNTYEYYHSKVKA